MHRQDPRRLILHSAWLLPVLCTGCANTDGVTINPVVIRSEPLPDDEDSLALQQYYQTVFARMRDALRGGTKDSLRELRYRIAMHKQDGMPDFAKEQIEQFERLGEGLEFELALPGLCRVESKTKAPRAHGKVEYELSVRPPQGGSLALGGAHEDVLAFQAVIQVRDFDSSGQFAETTHNLTLRVRRRHDFGRDGVLKLPFTVQGARAHVAIRELVVSIELLPGVVTRDGERLPVSQFTRPRRTRREVNALPPKEKLVRGPRGYTFCAESKTMLYPEGYEPIEKKPLDTLLRAVQLGGSKWFRHVFLSAHFMPEANREKAMARLMQWVRNGTGAQRLVAMGSLRVLSKRDLPVTDRDGWLRWWASRKK